MINGANGGWNKGYPVNGSYVSHGSFTQSGSYATTGYLQHCAPKPQPKPQPQQLWCLPIQNFRIDGGTTNLYSQKVSIDWPEFRPQSPIFAGPRVKQDTTDLIGTPSPNWNFDDCQFGNGTPGVINQLLPGFQQASQVYGNPYPYIDYSFGGMPVKW